MKNRTIALGIFILLVPVTLYLSSNKNESTPAPMMKQTHSGLVKKSPLKIEQWTSVNGARVYFVPTTGVPMVDVEINFNAGSARDDAYPGLASFCMALLDQGAEDLEANAIAAQFEDIGAVYSANAERDRTIISLRSLSDPKQLDPSVALLARLLSHPSFPEAAIENVRNQALVGLKKSLQQPHLIASFAFFKALYQDHPYAHPVMGTEAGVSAINQSALMAFHQQYFVGANANITIVGDISKEKAEALANTLMQQLPKGNPAPALPAVLSLTKPFEEHIPFQAAQTHIMLGQPCATSNDPDYFSLTIGNYILGGNPLNSRLYQEVRRNRGLVYSVRSSVSTFQQPAPFLIRLQTKSERTQEALTVTQETLARFVTEGPTEHEVAEAKDGLTRALPLDISSNDKITDFVSDLAFYRLPIDFIDTYDHHIKSVTVSDIKTAFSKRIDPKKMVLITVGSTTP